MKEAKKTGPPTSQPADKKIVRKKTKTQPLEKVKEKKAPAKHRLTVKKNVDKIQMKRMMTLMDLMEVSQIQERPRREDDDEDKPRRKELGIAIGLVTRAIFFSFNVYRLYVTK